MKTLALFFGATLALASVLYGQDIIDRLDDVLSVSTPNGAVRARMSNLLDMEGYYFQHPAPGLVDTKHQFLFNPRLTLFLDGQVGTSFYFFAQARLDRGFDPSDHGPHLQLDEYAVRYTPWKDGRLNVQFGKAATVVGTWTERHLSWDNPFINAPLPYENVTAVSDTELPASRRDFGHVDADEKYERLPVIWGPSYTTGLVVSGKVNRFEYAAELKNAALSSRPESWQATEVGFDHPAFDGRIGYRPDLAWNFGLSAGEGVYLRSEAERDLPAGRGLGDYREYLLGQDASYSAGHWQLWAEAFESRFEVPRVGNVDTFSYYLEAKYKFTPQLFGALRWNQQLFSEVRDAFPTPDAWRIDAAAGYRFTAHMQLKLQYSFQGDHPLFGEGSMVATQLTVRF